MNSGYEPFNSTRYIRNITFAFYNAIQNSLSTPHGTLGTEAEAEKRREKN